MLVNIWSNFATLWNGIGASLMPRPHLHINPRKKIFVIWKGMWLPRGCYGIHLVIMGSVTVRVSTWCVLEGYHVDPVTATRLPISHSISQKNCLHMALAGGLYVKA